MEIDLEIGDIFLSGKWKNTKNKVKKFGKDEHGQPTIINTDGKEIKLLNGRIEKLIKEKKSSMENIRKIKNELKGK